MIRDPKVENAASIQQFQSSNGFSENYSYILAGDTANAESNLFRGLRSGYYVFDKSGNQLCYKGSSLCSGVQFKDFLAAQDDTFQSCKNDSIHLGKVISECIDLNNKAVNMSDMPEANYYVVNYWQKFMGGKRGYKENILWMEDEIKMADPNLKIAFVKINTDLQENWGLQLGKKATMKLKRNKSNLQMSITDFPYKKSSSSSLH